MRLKHLSIVCFISLLSMASALFSEGLDAYLVLLVDRVHEGDWWRLISSHFCHSNGYHLLVNLAALAILVIIFEDDLNPFQLALLFLFAALGIGLSYALFYSPDTRYLGLSGVLHALASAGALLSLRRHRTFALVFMLGLGAKLVYENTLGASDSASNLIEVRVAVEAHIMGAALGGLFGLGYFFIDWFGIKKKIASK